MDASDFDVIELTDEIRAIAVALLLAEPRLVQRLRGFDAIQLATAKWWFERAEANEIESGAFVVADRALREGAQAIEMRVDNPGEHE